MTRWTPDTLALVATTREHHRTRLLDLHTDLSVPRTLTPVEDPVRYGWSCSCGAGRSEPSRWVVARDELSRHENEAILTALADAGLLVTEESHG